MPSGTNVVFVGTPFADDSSALFTDLGLAGNDILEGDSGDDLLSGLDGIDQIKGEVGDDTLAGGNGSDSVFGGADDDMISGGLGSDLIEGGADADMINGNEGNDTLYGDNAFTTGLGPDGSDTIFGGDGNDLIFGEGGADELFGGAGFDTIEGNSGNDLVAGGAGNDELFGGTGDDIIVGDAGNDILTGGAGEDIFVFAPETAFTGGFVDVITDFDVNEDAIDLTAFDLGVAELDAAQNNGANQFAFDDFSNGLTQGLDSSFFQIGSDVVINSRPELGYNLGSLGDDPTSSVILENVNIDDLGGSNFIFQDVA